MTISTDLIDRLSSETNLRMSRDAGLGRRQALAAISRCCVTVTLDGRTTHEEFFDKTPTAGEIAERIGEDAYIVSIAMRRQPLRERLRTALAAE